MGCEGGVMRSKILALCMMMAGLLALFALPAVQAKDYESRFVRAFPPGYYGMWYFAERFTYHDNTTDKLQEKYRWDRFMSRTTGMKYPFFPAPHAWDYGTSEKFNLPDYNSNDWR
jgi:hypothetical protein